MIWLELLWAAVPKRYLIGALTGAVLIGTTLVAYKRHQRAEHTLWFNKGATFVRDSALESTILRMKALRDSAVRASDALVTIRHHEDSLLMVQARTVTNAPRHTPRIEMLPIGDTAQMVPIGDMVSVYVESTGKRYFLPREAAREWFVSDSLVGVAQALLQKYAAANKQWSEAWYAEHQARLASDSLASAYATRLRDVELEPRPTGMSWRGKLLHAAAWAAVVLVVRNQIHR